MAPKNPLMFFGGIVLAIICVALTVYYILPGHFYRILATHDLYSPQLKHAIGFAVIAIVCLLVAVINRPRPSVVR